MSDTPITIGEGNTPIKSIQVEDSIVHLKLEFKNPSGSHKDRSTASMLTHYLSEGRKHFVISSSGNAGISLATFAQKFDLEVDIFVPTHISQEKKERFSKFTPNNKIRIHFAKSPKTEAIRHAQAINATYLRNSTDPYALVGYHSLAEELLDQVPNLTNVFFPSSSGTTLVGTYEGFLRFNYKPRIHAVQTPNVHTLIRTFVEQKCPNEKSLAKAIVDRIGHRRKQVVQAITDSKGYGWCIKNDEILEAQGILESNGINCSYEGGLALAGAVKARKQGFDINNSVVILTGVKG